MAADQAIDCIALSAFATTRFLIHDANLFPVHCDETNSAGCRPPRPRNPYAHGDKNGLG
jgi:hypothetical protein